MYAVAMRYLWLCFFTQSVLVTVVSTDSESEDLDRHYYARKRVTSTKTPPVYHQYGDYEDSYLFWKSLDQKLRDLYCNYPYKIIYGYCQPRFYYDYTYRNVAIYIIVSCRYPQKRNPSVLRQLVHKYCEKQSYKGSQEVDQAYERSTGCGLADFLNQICKDKGEKKTTTPTPTTTTTMMTSTSTEMTTTTPDTTTLQCGPDTCGTIESGVSGDTGPVQSPLFPCPYSRDTPFCSFRIEGPPGSTVTVTFDVFDIMCNDMVRIADGNLGNTIFGPQCGTLPAGTSVTTTSNVAIVILMIDAATANSAQGFSGTYTIN